MHDDVKMNRMHHTDFLDAPHGRGVLVGSPSTLARKEDDGRWRWQKWNGDYSQSRTGRRAGEVVINGMCFAR
jgi:hypothetical protein